MPARRRIRLTWAILAAYVVLTTSVTYLNLYRDTKPVALIQSDAAARTMFPWNFQTTGPTGR